jgi:hypothetical protein
MLGDSHEAAPDFHDDARELEAEEDRNGRHRCDNPA